MLEASGAWRVGARARRRRPRRHRRLPRHARLARAHRGRARVRCCAAGSGRPAPDTRPHPLRALARDAALPIAALTLVAALQNVDVIMAKHVLAEDAAGVYAAADGRRQGRGLDRRRPRLLGAAGGHPPGRRGRATRARCCGRAWRSSPRSRPCALRDLRRRRRSCCCGPRSAPSTSRAPTCCWRSASPTRCSPSRYLCVQFLLGLHRRAFVLGARADGGGRAAAAARRRRPRRLRAHRAGRARGRPPSSCWP